MQLIYRPDTGEILGVHILGLHAADLIHEASNAIALGTRIQVIPMMFLGLYGLKALSNLYDCFCGHSMWLLFWSISLQQNLGGLYPNLKKYENNN